MSTYTESFSLTTANKHQGRTLYEFLSDSFPFFEVDDWTTAIIDGSLFIDGVVVTTNPIVAAKQQVTFKLKDYSEEKVDCNWLPVWQNTAFLVAHKPALLPVHRTTRNIINTLTGLVRRDCQLPEAQVMHRLDLETAGLVLLAKTKADAKRWQPQLKTLLTNKTYRAVVYGKPIWTKKQFSSQLIEKRDGEIRCQMHVEEETENGKLSTTHFSVLSSNGSFSVVECRLLTGRKHQIRTHLAYLGHPIVGDKIYAHKGKFYLKRLQNGLDEEDFSELKAPHHLLVATSFELQFDGNQISVELSQENYPDAWKAFLMKQNC